MTWRITAAILLFGSVLFGQADWAGAASVEVVRPENGGSPLVIIAGDFDAGDDRKFADKVINLDSGRVLLTSNGGYTDVGIKIGKAIRLKEFETVVVKGLHCASSCALAWLGGTRRWMHPESAIGFHAAYVLRDGKPEENGRANALIGAYLSQLGLPERAISYISETRPEDMKWLSVEDARRVGIDVGLLEAEGDPPRTAPAPDKPARRARRSDYTVGSNADVVGEDLEAFRGGGVDECLDACVDNPRCGAFTYDRWNRVCFLKAKPRYLRLEPRATSGLFRKYASIPFTDSPSRMARYRGKTFAGKAWRTSKARNFDTCERMCGAAGGCVAFTFDKRRKSCRLFDYSEEYFADRNFDSGVKSQGK